MIDTTNKKIAFAYSGQGSSVAGMGIPYQKNPLFARRVQIADAICKKLHISPVSEFLYAKQTVSAVDTLKRGNLALFVYHVALTEVVLSAYPQPDFLIGHSFGEYSAWVLSGALSFRDGMKLVLKREEVCPSYNEAGYMIVVQTDFKTLESVLTNKVERLAVTNHETQHVLSLAWEELLDVEEKLKQEKIAFKRLLSPQPYHSPVLVASARALALFAENLDSLEYPRNPFYSPTLETWVDKNNWSKKILSQFAEKQLACPYNFAKSIQEIKQLLKEVMVLSPTTGLLQLLKMNVADEVTLTTASELITRVAIPQETKSAAQSVSGKSIDKVNRVISRITGYKIEDIKLEQRLSDDLGLDSIKTAEIVFEYMDQMKVSPSALREARLGQLITVKDLVLLAEKAGEVTLEEKKQPVFEPSLSFKWGKYTWKRTPLPKFSVKTRSQYKLVLLPKRILAELKSQTELKDFLNNEILSIQRSLNGKESLVLVSTQSFSDTGEVATPFFRSLVKEGVLTQYAHLIFDEIPNEDVLSELVEEELEAGNGETALYLKGIRHTEKFAAEQRSVSSHPFQYSCVVAVGGSKGITKELLKSFSLAPINKLYLMGRTPENEISEDTLRSLKNCAKAFVYVKLDATNESELVSALKKISDKDKIDLLILSSGVELSQELSKKTNEEIEKEFESKVIPAFAVASANVPVEKIWYHSSIIGRYGNAGQSIYALANKMAEILLIEQLTFAWPPWQDTGMTEKNSTALFLKSSGVGLLDRKEACRLFHETLHSKVKGNVAAVTEDLPLYTIPLISREGRANCEVEWQKGMPGFVFSYAKEDRYLSDHVYRSTALFPMAVAVSLSLASGRAVYNAPIRIRNFKILKPLPVLGAGQMRISLKGKAEMLSVDLLAQGPYAECVVDAFTAISEKTEIENLGIRKYLTNDLYRPDLLFHGPYFQTIQEISMGKDSLRAKVDPSRWVNSQELGAYGNFAQLMDTALQLGGIGAWALFDKKCLPVGFERLSFVENFDIRSIRYVLLRNAHLNGVRFTSDLLAVDSDGNIQLTIRKASFSSIPISPTPA